MPSFFPHQSISLAGDAQGRPSGFPALGHAQKPAWDSQPGASWLGKSSTFSSVCGSTLK